MRCFLYAATSAVCLLLQSANANAQCLSRNNDKAWLGAGVYTNGKLTVDIHAWRLHEAFKAPRGRLTMEQIDREATRVPTPDVVTLHSNAPGFHRSFEMWDESHRLS